MEYKPTIGLEIHVELKTKTKMFCRCLNDPEERHPNINVCPVCVGHPGTLPVINKEAVEKVLMLGNALNGKIATDSHFDRKNYFYPDLPKGYQISQYKYPLVEGGELNGVRITRIHLEEDTGRLSHGKGDSLVDYNRSGVPLMELVTEPDIKSGEDAKKFAEELQMILRYLEISDADMEKSQMRIEANISISPVTAGEKILGTKVEIKNLNSFRAVEKSVAYEIVRQKEVLEKGERVRQETRGWDEKKESTFSQREKEESHDYRYFPEPDLPALELSALSHQLSAIPELPQQKRERFKNEFGIKERQIEIIISEKTFSDFFEAIASELGSKEKIQIAANYLTSDLISIMKEKNLSWEELMMTPENFAEMISMIFEGKINSRSAKNILLEMIVSGKDPCRISEEKGLAQVDDEKSLREIAEKIISENPGPVNDFKSGKVAAMQALLGCGMKLTKGSINPEKLKTELSNLLK